MTATKVLESWVEFEKHPSHAAFQRATGKYVERFLEPILNKIMEEMEKEASDEGSDQ
jgi:hypothetical protein|tara:strand:+ start:1158 stop:1328 length:171 start_codon:yes stop_codon:yes gene_type:complete